MHTTMQERGYLITSQTSVSVAQAAAPLVVNGKTLYLHNTSATNTIYISTADTVSSSNWEIPPGYITGPFTADVNLYFISTAGTNTLKVLFVSLVV